MKATEQAYEVDRPLVETSDPIQSSRRSRPLLLLERTMYREGCTPFTGVFTVKLLGALKEGRLRQALAHIQAKHPLLRCVIEDVDGRPHFVLQDRPTPIPLRITERRNDDDWVEVSMHESLQRFDGSRQPLARLIWLRGEAESELLLVCSHAICDGRSLLTLLHEILLLCDRPDADIGSPTSLNAIEEIFPARLWADRGLQRRIRWKAAVVKLLLRFARSGRGWTYGKIYRSLWTLDEQTSQLLVARCKAEGVNLFAALSAASMLAFRAVCGERRLEKFEAPVDIRRFLPDLRERQPFLGARAAGVLTPPQSWPTERP